MDTHNTAPTGALKVGVIGLGVMGLPMARNILNGLSAGSELHVYNRTPEISAEFTAAGAQFHADSAGVGEAADVIILMVPAIEHVEDAVLGARGLTEGVTTATVVAISSTVSAEGVRDVARRAADASDGLVHVIDAPVSGGEEGAIAGTLSVMIGGPDDDVAAAMPVLELVGTPAYLGPLGSGQIVKACNQMIVASTVAALAEAAVLAEKSGIDVARMYDLLGGGYAGSRVMEVKKRRFAEHDHSPSGPAKFMIKDLKSAQESARAVQAVTPQTDLLLELFTDLTERGNGDADSAVIQAHLETLAAEANR